MKELSWIEQVEYLVKIKFPMSNKPPPIMNHGGSYARNDELHQKLLSEIKSYKDELFSKTRAEVKSLYDLEKAKQLEAINLKIKLEEQSRFFNLDNANADFVHWSKAAHWSLDEALALSFGKSPDIVTWDIIKSYTQVSAFAKEYEKRRDLALRALPWKKLYDPMLPTIFISWAKELDIELPANLISNVEKKLGIAVNWFEEYQKIKIAYDEMKNKNVPVSVVTEKPLSTRTENNYLRLIMQLANGIKDFNPQKPYEAAQLIIDETGTDISKQTISDYLTKAYQIESEKRD